VKPNSILVITQRQAKSGPPRLSRCEEFAANQLVTASSGRLENDRYSSAIGACATARRNAMLRRCRPAGFLRVLSQTVGVMLTRIRTSSSRTMPSCFVTLRRRRLSFRLVSRSISRRESNSRSLREATRVRCSASTLPCSTPDSSRAKASRCFRNGPYRGDWLTANCSL
jgi:hypothetical protein